MADRGLKSDESSVVFVSEGFLSKIWRSVRKKVAGKMCLRYE